jgi:hypothetical protein
VSLDHSLIERHVNYHFIKITIIVEELDLFSLNLLNSFRVSSTSRSVQCFSKLWGYRQLPRLTILECFYWQRLMFWTLYELWEVTLLKLYVCRKVMGISWFDSNAKNGRSNFLFFWSENTGVVLWDIWLDRSTNYTINWGKSRYFL